MGGLDNKTGVACSPIAITAHRRPLSLADDFIFHIVDANAIKVFRRAAVLTMGIAKCSANQNVKYRFNLHNAKSSAGKRRRCVTIIGVSHKNL
jgi:hypothetical protein